MRFFHSSRHPLRYRDAGDWEGRGSAGGRRDHLHQRVARAGRGALWEKHRVLSNYSDQLFSDCKDCVKTSQRTAD